VEGKYVTHQSKISAAKYRALPGDISAASQRGGCTEQVVDVQRDEVGLGRK